MKDLDIDMERNETNYFTFNNLLENMIVFKRVRKNSQTIINMAHILELIKDVHSIKSIDFMIGNEKFQLHIFYITEQKFSFQLEDIIVFGYTYIVLDQLGCDHLSAPCASARICGGRISEVCSSRV